MALNVNNKMRISFRFVANLRESLWPIRDGSMMGPTIPVFRYGYGSFYISSEREGPETRLAEGAAATRW